MKKIISTAVLFFLSVYCVVAQDPPVRDTVWGAWPNQAYYNGILVATVVTGESEAINILPTQGPYCFDKKMTLKVTMGGRVFEQCMYLDTRGGLVGYLKPVPSATGNMCDMKPDTEDFWFSVIGHKGNVYIYSNTIKNGLIEHWVSTGNTQTYLFQGPGSNTGIYTLHNKHERKGYCDEKIKATSYKVEVDASPLTFLFGKTYPEAINVTGNKYIGSFGVGYQDTDKGLYIIMEIQSSAYTCKITSIEEVNVCFDPSPFRIMENEFLAKRRAELLKEREKIARDEARIRSDDECSGPRQNMIRFKKDQLRQQEEALVVIPQGSIYQNQNVQKAITGMMDPLTMVNSSIMEMDISICNTEVALRRDPSSNLLQGRLSCLRGLRARLGLSIIDMVGLDIQYANDPAKALGEKSRIYLELMRTRCD